MFQNLESFADRSCCGYFSLALSQKELQHVESLRIVVHHKHAQAMEFLHIDGPAIEKRFVLWFQGPGAQLRASRHFGQGESDFKRGTLPFTRAVRGDRATVGFREVAHDGET